MREQDLFHYLFWFSPTISGILTVMQALENAIFFPKTPIMVPYSFCAKTPFPMEKMDELITLKVRGPFLKDFATSPVRVNLLLRATS